MLSFNLATANEIGSVLGERLRRQRLARELQQRELAARAGISETTLRNLETRGVCTLETFIKVIMALGVADELAGFLETRHESIQAMEAASSPRQRVRRKRT